MPHWFWIAFLIIHLLSWGWFFLIRRDEKAFLESQIWVLGKENVSWVKTKALRLYKLLYSFGLLFVTIFSFILFFFL